MNLTRSQQNRWKRLKMRGSDHYKSSGIEPIDLMRDLGILRNFAIGSIIKYACRNREGKKFNGKDMDKIIHYSELLLTVFDTEVKVGDKQENTSKARGRVKQEDNACWRGTGHDRSASGQTLCGQFRDASLRPTEQTRNSQESMLYKQCSEGTTS